MTDTEILHGNWNSHAHWSRTNLSEAMPGVLTPLSWSVWQPVFERSIRRSFAAIGALERSRVDVPSDPADWMYAIFFGRVAAKVEFLGEMGDRLPGTSGAAIAEQFFGALPDNFESRSTLRRLPVIAWRFPAAMATSPRRVRAAHARTALWWSGLLRTVDHLDFAQARDAWGEALEVFEAAFCAHTSVNLACVQPGFDQLQRLAAAAEHPELAGRLVAGRGDHVEGRMIEDLWAVSRGGLSLDEFVASHGYHGPREGEISSRVWRDDLTPLMALVKQYEAMPESSSPARVAQRRRADAEESRRIVLAALSPGRRLWGRAVLAAADRSIGLRGVGKAAFVQALDGARMIALRIGAHLAARGVIDTTRDVFYLSADEVGACPTGESLQALVAQRKREHHRLQQFTLPTAWYGTPTPTPSSSTAAALETTLSGVGASPGVVEGPVRVITDPSCDGLEPGEILVAPVTDPSWAAIMFVSAGLIVDIGGALSHAAVVARELGIPCVMGVAEATATLRSGDICRIDGQAGTVEIVHRIELETSEGA